MVDQDHYGKILPSEKLRNFITNQYMENLKITNYGKIKFRREYYIWRPSNTRVSGPPCEESYSSRATFLSSPEIRRVVVQYAHFVQEPMLHITLVIYLHCYSLLLHLTSSDSITEGEKRRWKFV